MIAVIQRVSSASVSIGNQLYSEIGYGYVIFLGVCKDDSETETIKLAKKIIDLRINADENDKMNLSIKDIKGEILVVSQFTLCVQLSGRRPSFTDAKEPKEAERLYNQFIEQLKESGVSVKTGKFGARMQISLINDGPVTFIIDTKE